MPPSHGNPNKTWIIFITQRMADFTGSPSELVWLKEVRDEKKWKKRKKDQVNAALSLWKGNISKNHQWRAFLQGGKKINKRQSCSLASVRHCNSCTNPPNISSFHKQLTISSFILQRAQIQMCLYVVSSTTESTNSIWNHGKLPVTTKKLLWLKSLSVRGKNSCRGASFFKDFPQNPKIKQETNGCLRTLKCFLNCSFFFSS